MNPSQILMLLTVISFSFPLASGCERAADRTNAASRTVSVPSDRSSYLLQDEPDGAVGVIAAHESAEDGKPLVMVGRIGGVANPWVEGRAAFTLLDASMTVVAEGQEMAEGVICEGNCCATERLTSTALVKVIDADDKLVGVDSRQLLGVKESDLVVVEGRAQRDDNGNFVMLARRVYIRR